MKALFNYIIKLALALSLIELAVMPSQAQVGGQAASGKTQYEKIHSYEPGKGTFKKDPNVWVLTSEFAERTGMPREWASSELQGAEAVAFRYEQDGAEEECGWMGDPGRCAPVFQCVLGISFDNSKHKPPWETVRPSMYDRSHSSIRHLGAMPWPLPSDPNLRKEEQLRRRKLYSPFTDLESGKELRFNNVRAKAYDRDLYAGLSIIKLDLGGCHGIYRIMPEAGVSDVLELKESCDLDCGRKPPSAAIFHRIVLPYEWRVRVATRLKEDADRWKKITSEAIKKAIEENQK